MGREEAEPIRIMHVHADRMDTKDPDLIAEDYAEDAVFLSSSLPEPLVGRKAIRDYMEQLIKQPSSDKSAPDDEVQDISAGEYALHIFKNTSMGVSGIETYHVRNGKILMESCVFKPLGD